MKQFNEKEHLKFQEDVLNYLDYLGYPDWIQVFEPIAVSRAIATTTMLMYFANESVRMTALVIMGMTWRYQISKLCEGETIQ